MNVPARLTGCRPAWRYIWQMSRLCSDSEGVGQCTPVAGAPPEPLVTIAALTVSFRELTDKRDRLKLDVDKLRRRIAEATDELDLLQRNRLELSWRPAQVEKQRLEQY